MFFNELLSTANMSFYVYKFLIILRIAQVFLPQHGYIHPDEQFQCSEIVYGDMLELQILRTWEFNATQPIRSTLFPYLTAGIPSIALKAFDIKHFLGTETYPYLLLILPRLVMCLLTFIHDITLHKLCTLMKKNPESALTVFASSYVCLVYYIRTFSNSFEAVYFTLTIYIVCKSITNLKLNLSIYSTTSLSFQNLFDAYVLGAVFTIGFITRPSFLFFALSPLLYWMFSTSKASDKLFTTVKLIASFILGSFSIMFTFVAIDSFYYNKVHFRDFFTEPAEVYKHLVLTPLNFILYNMNNKNLITHGAHPKFLHAAVNMPLLFSILCLFLYLDTIKMIYILSTTKKLLYNHFMIISVILPIIIFSCFPHQEARFLIPLLLPLAYLYGDKIFNTKSKFFVIVWFILNVLSLVIFGFLHQAGLFPALTFLHTELDRTKNNSHVDIIFYRTYMPPRYLLAIPESWKNITVHDYGGIEMNHFEHSVLKVINNSYSTSLYIVTQQELLEDFLKSNAFVDHYFNFVKKVNFFPHLSMENLPDKLICYNTLYKNISISDKLHRIKNMFSIDVHVFVRHLK